MFAKPEFLMSKWMRKSVYACLAAAAAVTIASSASAAVQDVFSYVTDQSTYSAKPGDVITVKIYLKDQVANGNATPLLANVANKEAGLFGAGLSVAQSAGAPANPVTITGVALDTFDFAGPSGIITNTPTLVSFNEAIGNTQANAQLANTANGAAPNTPANQVYLGSVTLTAGSSTGTTTFKITGLSGNTLSGTSGYDLDQATSASPEYSGTSNAVNTNTFSVNVAPVPEPASLGIFAAASAAALARRPRRRR